MIILGSARWAYEMITGALLRAAGYRRRAVLVGSGRHIEDVAHALRDEVHVPVEMVGFISLTPRPDNGLRSLGRIEDVAEVLDVYRVQEVIIADPDFPEERAVELVDTCHQRGVTVRVAPSTMEILVQRAELVPGTSVPLFELRPPVFDGFDYFIKRTFDVSSRCCCCSPLAAAGAERAARALSPRAGRSSTAPTGPGIGGEPFACLKFRTMYSDADERQAGPRVAQRGQRPAVQDPPRPAPDAHRARSCAATRSTSCRSSSTSCAARCRSSARARCPSATSTSSRTGTRSATSCCPA